MAPTPSSALPLAAALALVVCPVCHSALEAVDAGVLCLGCHRRYPVRDGIPVLIAGEAAIF